LESVDESHEAKAMYHLSATLFITVYNVFVVHYVDVTTVLATMP